MKLYRMLMPAIVLASTLPLLTLEPANASQSRKPRIIDRLGEQIPSVFYGIGPSPRIALEYFRARENRENPRACHVQNAIYRESEGIARFLKVQSGCDYARYQVAEYRNCGSYCGGGEENWTYSDSLLATYCDRYQIDMTACNTQNCQEDTACWDDACGP